MQVNLEVSMDLQDWSGDNEKRIFWKKKIQEKYSYSV